MNKDLEQFENRSDDWLAKQRKDENRTSAWDFDEGWKMSDAPKEYLMDQLNDLIVFEINISKVQAQSKLSQNREKRDFDSVIKNLQERGKNEIAESMLRIERN